MKKNQKKSILDRYFDENSKIYEKIVENKILKVINEEFNELLLEQSDLQSVRGQQTFLWNNNIVHNPKNKPKEEWIDGKKGPEYRNSVELFQRLAKKAGVYDKKIDADFGGGTKDAAKALIAGEWDLASTLTGFSTGIKNPPADDVIPDSGFEYSSDQAPERFMSDKFSLLKVKSSDPELYKAIKATKGKDLTESRLFFDGEHLHWFIGREHIIKFPASSGHFEDSSLAYGKKGFKAEAQAATLELFKVVKQIGLEQDDQAQSKIVDMLRNFAEKQNKDVDYIIIEKAAGDIISDWKKMKQAEKDYQSVYDYIQKSLDNDETDRTEMNKDELEGVNTYSEKYRKASRRLIRSFNVAIDNIFADFKTSHSDRKKQMHLPGMGPIPEGAYSIKHRLHDLSNDLQVNFYDFITIGAEVLYGEKSSEYSKFTDTMNNYRELIGDVDVDTVDGGITDKKMGDSLWNWAWGNFRVRISQGNKFAKEVFKKNRKTYGRSGFYIHGGDFRGSGGCIDLQDQIDRFARFWTLTGLTKIMGPVEKALMRDIDTEAKLSKVGREARAEFSIPLFVKYDDEIKNKLMQSDAVAQKDSELIFNKTGVA